MQAITFVCLGLAVLTAWLPSFSLRAVRLPVWPVFYAAALWSASAAGYLDRRAWIAIGAFALVTAAAAFLRHKGLRAVASAAAVVFGLALALHLLPGFANPRIWQGLRLTPDAAPFSLYLNFDKATAGLFLLAAFVPRLPLRGRAWRGLLGPVLVATAATSAVVLGTAWAMGFTEPHAKWPGLAVAGTFLAMNLLFTCMTEEVFFRGLLQQRLSAWLGSGSGRTALAVALSAAAFGAVHLPGGTTLALLAAMAGVGYGLVYQRTRRIEAAILTHFLLNAVHFLGFTYPVLAR